MFSGLPVCLRRCIHRDRVRRWNRIVCVYIRPVDSVLSGATYVVCNREHIDVCA